MKSWKYAFGKSRRWGMKTALQTKHLKFRQNAPEISGSFFTETFKTLLTPERNFLKCF